MTENQDRPDSAASPSPDARPSAEIAPGLVPPSVHPARPGYGAPVAPPPADPGFVAPAPALYPPPVPTGYPAPYPGQYPGQYPLPYPTQDSYPATYPGEFPAVAVPAPVEPTPALPGSHAAPLPTGRRWTRRVGVVLGVFGLGFAGGLVATEVSQDDATPSSALIGVERRTAAPLPVDNTSLAAVAAKVLPSTVQIIASFEGDDFGATGSGFVLDDEGHVVTNNHVIADAAENDAQILVIAQGGQRFRATVVGRSPVYDLAVLKIKGAGKLNPVALGSADQMRVGETVVAIGSPLGLSATVTSGIVSAVNRPVTTGDGDDSSFINAVQTDTAINPGNSGGPLVNLQGEVIGVNSAIASLGSSSPSDEGGSIGVGFAIPVEQVRVTTTQILTSGKAFYPVIGANVEGRAQFDGATVATIQPGGPASKSDLREGDVITAVDGKPVTGSSDVVVAVRSRTPNETVTLTVRRGGRTLTIEVGLRAVVG